MERDEMCAAQSYPCFSYKASYSPIPHSLTTINNPVGKTTGKTHFPPQSVINTTKLGRVSMSPHFKPATTDAKEMMIY